MEIEKMTREELVAELKKTLNLLTCFDVDPYEVISCEKHVKLGCECEGCTQYRKFIGETN